MNRRTFLAATLFALAAPRGAAAVTPVARTDHAIRAFETVDPAPNEPERAVVRVDRIDEGLPPFPTTIDELIELGHFVYLGAMRGEYYIGEQAAIPAPDDLAQPALFAAFISSAGIAAFREEHTLGMVQRDHLRWTIQATGGAGTARKDLVTGLALLLAGRRPDGTPVATGDDGHLTGGLWDLLPAPGDFPFEVRVTEETSSVQVPRECHGAGGVR
jgi:hypothetical protein